MARSPLNSPWEARCWAPLQGWEVGCRMPSCPAPPPKVTACQLYPSLGQWGPGLKGARPGCCWWLRLPGGQKGQRKKMGAESSLGESLKSHKMPEESGDKQPLTPKQPLICIIHA